MPRLSYTLTRVRSSWSAQMRNFATAGRRNGAAREIRQPFTRLSLSAVYVELYLKADDLPTARACNEWIDFRVNASSLETGARGKSRARKAQEARKLQESRKAQESHKA